MSSRTPLLRTIGLVSVVFLFVAGLIGHALTVATIASDAPEYVPGHAVTLFGSGWTTGETVTIVIHREPLLHPDTVLTVVADGSGTITNTSFATALDEDGVTFSVTATGSQSGQQATGIFKAKKRTWSGAVSTDWNTAGNWSPSGVPEDKDDLTIFSNVLSGRYPVVSSGSAFGDSVLLEAGPGTQPSITVSGGSLSVGNLAIEGGTLNVSGGTLFVTADIDVHNATTVNVSGTGVIHLASAIGTPPTDSINIFQGATFNQSGGTVNTLNFNNPGNTNSTGGAYNQSGGTLRVYKNFKNTGSFVATAGTIEFAGSGSSNDAFDASGTNQFFNVVVDNGVSTDFSSAHDAAILVRGNWTMNGTADLTDRVTTVTFNGSGPQTIGGLLPTNFRNLTVNKPADTVTLARTALVTNGNVTVLSGTLDLSSFIFARSSPGGAISVANGATLKIGGNNTFPRFFQVHTFGATSTVDYYGTNQDVSAEDYGHLNLSTSGTKTMPATTLTTQGNFTMSGTASATAAAQIRVNGNFTLGPGTTFGAASFDLFVKGNFTNSGSFNAGTSQFTFNGSSVQTVGGSNATTFNNLTINNSSGVSLAGVNTTVNGVLTFTSGNVTTGAGQFIATSSTGSVSHGSGHVVGSFQKFVPTGAPVLTYEIGDAISYTPVILAFANVSVGGNATGSTTTGDSPNAGSSPIDPLKSVNRYWTWIGSGLAFTTYTATFTFVPSDIDPGANPNNFIVGKFSGGSWTTPQVGTRTPTSTQITGVTTFSDFEIGEGGQSTTLGNGVDPVNATVAPGAAATMAGAFTLQTSAGTDTVSAVTVTLAAGTSPAVALVEITDDAGATVYGSVADPTSNIVAITLTGVTATTSSTQYKIRITPKSHAAMPVPPGSSYALTAAVSAWTGSNGQTGSDSGGTTVTIDNLSPSNVTGGTATSGNAQVTLTWTNPADSDLGTIVVLRRAGSAVSDAPAEGATYAVGNTIGSSTVACVVAAPATGCTDSGLTTGTVYHYEIFARDIDGNYATGAIPIGSPVAPNVTTLGNGADPGNATVAPGGAATMADAFTLQTGGGTDTIIAITVSLAPGTSGGVSHVEITNDAGTIVYGELSNPVSDAFAIPLSISITATASVTQYKIRITPRSHAAMPPPPGSLYALTARVSSWAGTNAQAGSDSGGTVVTIDNLSSGNVTGATAISGNTQNTLAWTNPTDADLSTLVVLRQAGSPVTDAPAEGVTIYLPGDVVGTSTVACVVTAPATGCTDAGLSNGTAYHYKIFARGANGNYSTGVVPTGSPVAPNATTLGDGTPVSDATIAPGGAATMADAFAFRTGTGTDNITAVTVALTAGTSAGVSLVEITDVAGTVIYGSVSNPSSDAFTIALSTNIIATTTVTQYRIRITPKSHAAMPVPPGTGYALSAHLSDWTGSNAHSGSDSGNTVITIDNQSPGNATIGIVTAGSTHVVLGWVNPVDSDLVTIVVLRRSGSAVGDTPAEGATYSVGDTIGSSTVACVVTAPARACTDTGLTNGTPYHYKIFTRDLDGNYATGLVPAGSPATPFAGITVTPTSGLTTTEAGGTATFTVVLTSRPVADVTIGLSSSDTTEGTVSPSSLTFTSLNWNVPQTVTVTGVNDVLDDGDIAYSIITAPATSTGGYNGLDAADVTVTNIDDDTAGITVSPTSGLSTTEAGGTATFTIVLKTQPTADVTIGLSSSNTAEGTVSPASVTFTSVNWDVPRTVTITGVNDFVADGNIAYTIVTAAATSGDGNYTGLNPSDVSVTNIDNNTVGIIVNPTLGLTTTEAGTTAAFAVALSSQPTADVTIALGSSDTTEGTISVSSLTFTSANWNIPQIVTITGVNDALDDGDIGYTIVTGAATSGDSNYNGINPSDVSVTNLDDDTAGITVSPTSGLTTTEAGGTATFTIVLTSQPTADVTIGLSSSNTAEGTVSPGSVTFTAANWNVPQTVTAIGVDGPQVDGDIPYTIVTTPATSTDPNYSGRNAPDVSVTNLDNDTAGITVTPTTGLTTTEAGGTATFTVVLTSQPAADVTIGLSSNDLTEGTVSTASLTFTSANWHTPQTVTVTGVNNPVDDGDILYKIVTAPATSADPDYSGFNASDVSVTNIDDDTAGIIVTPTSGLTTAEIFGTPATFTVVLTSRPTAEVVIDLSSSDPTEGAVSPVSLTFTSANWNVPQTVTVNGVNDVIIDGDIAYSIITAPATSGDPKYNGLDASDVSLTNIDSDTATFFLTPVSGLTTTEAGGTATFTIVMNAQPTADVTVGLSSSNTNEGTVGPASITFTSANWNVPQTVTVTGVNDFAVDGPVAYTVVTAAATSADPHFNGVNPVDVSVTNTDNDTAGITVVPTTGLTTEAGGTSTFTVVLTSQPAANVTIGLTSSNPAEGTVSVPSLTFTSANWNLPQTVTVTGVNDVIDDGDVAYTIITAPATSGDPHYAGLNASDVSMLNDDDDTAGITVTPSNGLTTSEAGGTATFTVVLNSQPTADVTIGLSSTDTTEGTVSAPSVTFTSANWNVPQTVTVTGVNDAVDDGNIAYAIVTAPANSTDPRYNGVNAINVAITNLDDDAAGITVTPTAGLTTTEAGGTATFTVVLTSLPTADVTIGLISSDTTEGTVSAPSLIFTSANWNVPQTVTVTGVNDTVDDGDIAYIIFTGPATSADPKYNAFDPGNVSITNTDDEASGFTITPASGLNTTEAGGTATFTVVLTVQPTADVTIGLSSSNTAEGTVSPASLTFTSANWNVPQTVTVTGVNDVVDDGDVPYVIVTSAATSADPNYAGINPIDVVITNTDNDTAGITVTPTTGLTTTEAGGTAQFTVVLTSQPTADVTVGLASSNTAEGTIGPASLTFTPANWNVAQTVTVTGVNDAVADGNVGYIIVLAPAASSDSSYSGLNASNVVITNTDNDIAGVTVTPTSGLTTTEAGGTATFTVVLTSQPTADVTIGLSSSNTNEGTVSPASVIFTNLNWNVPQVVTVTGVNDVVVDGNVAYTIVTAAATSTDSLYSGFNASDVTVTNTDNDVAGITVTPITGLTTTEGGGVAQFAVRLNSQPSADVTIGLSSSNTNEGTVGPASLTFTSLNWNVFQAVTVTGVDDVVADGNVAYTIVTAAATSSDPKYSGVNAGDVTVTNADNDTAEIAVTPTSGLTTTEAGGSATFTVVLTTQPIADVTIGLSSNNTAEGTVGPTSLIFTNTNWNVPQTVTVTGVNDTVVDGDVLYTVVTAAATSTDPSYSGLNASDVTVTNTDDDVAGITVSPTSGLTTTEAGGTATFTVVLTSQPTADVTIGLTSSNTAEGTVGPASLTFTSLNWNIAQTVTVTGVNDAVVDGNVAYTIVTAAATSTDTHYNGLNTNDVAVTNTDNDVAGITVTPTSGLTTTEAGGTTTFTVVLNSQPAANVTIGLSSNDTTEGTVGPASLTFTSANWSVPQIVTVTGVNDLIVDGNVLYTIVTAAATSTDPNYAAVNASDVTVTNTDNDIAGITVTPTSGLSTTEAGGTATFTVVLNSQPAADVTIGLSSSNSNEGTVAPVSLIFTSGNWNVAQAVTVTGVNDQVVDGNVAYTIVTAAATSTDPNYNGVNASDVTVTNTDNDIAGITVSPTSGLTTSEGGGTATFTVVLNTQPSANVTIGLSSSNTAEGTVSPASLTFTNANWNVPQVVTVTGVNDAIDDGNVAYSIVTAAATSTDANYNGMNASDVGVTNLDNDAAGITVTPTSGLTTSESGGVANFTVVLNTQPSANVTIGLSSSNTAEGTVSPASLTFTSANWNVPQIVSVSGVNDPVVDGAIVYTIVTAAATSTDPNYNGVNASDVTVTNTDNDTAGITVTPTSGLTTTESGGTATFTVVLSTQPTASVTIGLSSSNTAEGTVGPSSLTFTNASWNIPQTVTVTGVNDVVVDGAVLYTIVTAAATSADPNYNGVNASDVTVTNTDNDTAGMTVTPTSGLTTTEAGGTATFMVVLNSQPSANVTIGLSSSNTAEGTVGPPSLVFTNANWNVAQTVTVTGVNDLVVDGNVTYTIVTAAATSSDLNYNGVNASDVTATNADNDTAGITVNPTAGLTTTEAGGTAAFALVLNTQPTADVTIGLSSSNTAEGTVGLASVTFTSLNWNVPQAVTVTGVNDLVVDGNVVYTILTAAAISADPNYNGLNPSDVTVSNTDNDTAGVTVTPTSGLTTTEAGGTAQFTVVLNSQPVADVTIGLSSSNTAEGTVSPASLVFTSANWNVAQTVTVTGVNDQSVDGNVAYTIVTAGAASADPNYSGLNASDVTVTNTDNDTAGMTVSPTSGLTTTEGGGTATFTVVLNSQPTAAVAIGLSSSNTNEGTLSPSILVFTNANWNVPQAVTVTGVNDPVVDGNVAYTIVTAPAISSDPNYSGVNASDVTVTNADNDTAGITVSPTSGLTTTEAGGTATFTVVLNTQPAANVTIGLSSTNTNEGTVGQASLTFTSVNWNVAQTVTVTGIDDVVADGNVAYTIVTAAATSTDPNYNGVNASDVTVTNADNDTAEIAVSPTAGLTTTEAGGLATFTVVLTTQPTADVTIGLSSSNTAEGTVGQASLIFTNANWNVAQTVTVTGVNDAVVDGNVAYTIVTAAATSADPNYNGLNASDVTVTNLDNDTVGILVTPTSGLTTTEAGGTAQFTVRLNSQPTANVTIALSSSNTAEGTVSPASLTFTSANWNLLQTVTVTGVNDVVVDGNVAYTIVTAPATSTDPNYNNVNANDVTVTNTDNDTAGITVTPASGLTTTEAGGTATFTMVLNTQPTANVTIGLSSNDTTEGAVSPASLTFTSANWNVPQTVTVTGVNDAVVDGNIAYAIVTAPATSTDANYNGVNAIDVTVTNTDNDAVGITVTPTVGLTTTEAGGSATFTVVLTSQPTASVTIGLSSSNPAEGTVSPASLTFTNLTWNVPQSVTVTGVNDLIVDGNVVYTIVTAAAASADPNYNGVNASDVAVTNTDNDTAGITVSPTSGLTTTEAGGTATFTVVLNTQPAANVTVGLSSSNTNEGTVSPASLVFTSANWNVPRTVTVTGVNDSVVDGNIAYTIATAVATSSDPNYNGLNASDVTVTNTDNDTAGITVSPTSGLTTTEAGGTATFTVLLNSQPTADVTIGLSSSNANEGTVGPASLTFTNANWNVAQTVTVTGVNDAIADGNVAYTIVTAAATSTDPNYSGVNANDVTVTNTDNDIAGITVTPTSGLTTTEAGGTATFTVVLTSQPTADVTVGLTSSNTNEGTVGPASLTFTSANWNVAQTVTVTGVNDTIVDGNVAYTIITAAATSTDSNYNGVNASDVTVTNSDNDTAGITVTPTSGLTTTEAGGTTTFTVVLNSQPTADVTIGLSSSNTLEGTVGPTSLTFTNVNWNVPQTVTVTGVNDLVVDGNIVYTIVTAAATSTDSNYGGVNASDVTSTNTDNDTAGITVTPTSGLTTTEAGGTATFTVVLASQPTANVTIGLSSSNSAEGIVGPASLTFTTVNWNVPQTVTVTGVNDSVVDGNVAYTIITAAATATDSNYGGVNASDVTVSNTDDDVLADLSVTTTNGASAVTAGGATTYTIVVSNAGPGLVVGATVTDIAPVNVTFGAWTCVASAGSTCPASGTGNISALVNLLAGGTATFTVPAAISTAASGTVTNTATVVVPASVVDPTPGNNSSSEVDTVTPAPIPTADLSVTKTNGGTLVTVGATSTYTVIVSNAGPNAANGAILTDPVAAGLTKTTVICTAAGGAACPASPTTAQIEAGLAIPALPVGGSLTFTITATVTAASGSVSNIATIAAPAGVIDPAVGNNSATDTDTVAAAPIVADLVATITDNTTLLVPGAVTVYAIVVTNQGPGAVTGATVTNTAPAGLTFGNWTCVASAGSSCTNSGIGDISTTVSLLAGGTATFTVPATVAAGAPASVANTAVAAVPAGVTDPVPANNTATDVDQAVPPQSVGLAIHAGAMTVVGPSAFEVPFTVDVINTGVNPLTNLQVADSLSSAFAEGAPTITITGPPTANRAVSAAITATPPCVPNAGFTGIGSVLDPGTQLLSGSPPLAAGQGCTIAFTVRLTYASATVIPATPQSNSVVARTATSSGSSSVTVATAESEATVQLQLPRVDITKMLTGMKQVGSEPVFDVSYAIVIKNTSQAAAPNVQAIDNLAATFAPGAPVIAVVSAPKIESGSASLTVATGANAFNGTTATAILVGSDTMAPGTESRIAFTVRVKYASGSSVPVGTDLNNSAIATTSGTPGGIVISHDESTDVTESGAPPQADDEPSPTPVRLVPQAQLAVQKIANMLVAEIGDAVQYAVRVRNVAGPVLPEVSVTDRLPLGFRYIAGSARMGADGAAQPLPDPAGGAGPVLTFAIPAQAESAEVLITYRVRVGPGALQGDGVNRAEAASSDARSNTAGARVLVSGGVFTTDACVVGAIFVDLNHNGLQDVGEPGVPDVELHFEEGTSLLSDLHGKYSYCGLTPATHVLKVDGTTLPAGATLAASSNRNAGNAGSLFVDLKFGEVRRADFIVDGSATQAVLDEIGVRQARAEIWVPKFEESAGTGVAHSRPATGTGASSRADAGAVVGTTGAAQIQTAGGFEPIRQAGGLNAANSNAPEPLPAAADPPAVSAAPMPGGTTQPTTLRPMLLVGLLDGAVSFSKVDGGLLAPARPEAVFDREFTRFTGSFDSGQGQYGGRGAVFVKGTVATHYLMTFAYDSDKDVRGALFRDIQPEAFYPIYGDGSEKRFDAQTSGRFYARVDRGHSYLMYGDLQTSSFSPEAQALGAYNRALTGVQHHFENSRTMINVFASHDSLRQVIDEYAARGISGPYPVSNPNGVSGTERVEIITRDRNQPALVLSAVQLTRFTDYEFEPFSGRLLFRMPVPSLDERLNPVSIRVTYEVDAGGDKSWVGGGNVQMRLGSALQVGGSWIEDGTPGSPYRLISANTTLRLGKSSTVVFEAAQSTGTINTGIGGSALPPAAGVDAEGLAARIEWRHTSSRLVARAFGAFSDPGFNNPASTLAGGRTEAGGRARLTITKGVSFIGEAIHSEDRLTGGRRDGGLLSLETKWKPLVFEVGMRRASETGKPSQGTSAGIPLFGSGTASGFGFGSTDTRIDPVTGQPIVQPGFGPQLSAGPNAPAAVESPDVMTVRAKLTFLIGKRTDVYGEAEQDVRSAERRVAAVGAQLKFSDKLKLYARHEFISSLDGPYALTDGQKSYNTVFGVASTYMKDADLFSEYRLGDAISGREAEAAIGLRNHWSLTKGLRLSTGFERVQSIASGSREATAVSAGLEYTASTRLKGTGRIEWRQDSSSDSWLSTVGVAERLSHDWTMLARNYYQVTVPEGAPNLVQDRFSIGAAYRDSAKNRLNLLTRYEFRIEDTAGLTFGTATDRQVQIVSTHADFHPLRAWTFEGQHALKFVDDQTELSPGRFGIQLVSGRVGYDIAKRWDVGALTSVMWGGEGGRRSAVGGEVGFQLRGDLWLSAGYNFTGFTDRDLVSSNFTTRGAFVRIRMKFDESVVPASARGGR